MVRQVKLKRSQVLGYFSNLGLPKFAVWRWMLLVAPIFEAQI